MKIYCLKDGERNNFSFQFKASNGRVLLNSFPIKDQFILNNRIKKFQKQGQNPNCYIQKKSTKSRHYFHFQSLDGILIATSKRYSTAASRDRAIRWVMANAATARVEGLSA